MIPESSMDESLVFLYKIKEAFPNEPEVYLTFEKLMRAFLGREVDGPTMGIRVTELFHGHPDLLLGFSRYLPAVCSSDQPMNALQLLDRLRRETALSFVNAVEMIYLGQPHIFAEFAQINLDANLHPLAKLTKIRTLFHENPTLIKTFQGFMPAGFAIEADLYKIDPAPLHHEHEQDN